MANAGDNAITIQLTNDEKNLSFKQYLIQKFFPEHLKLVENQPVVPLQITYTLKYKDGEEYKTIILTVNVCDTNCDCEININGFCVNVDQKNYKDVISGLEISELNKEMNEFDPITYTVKTLPIGGTKKGSSDYVKTSRKYLGKDGMERVIYTKGGKDYVKRKMSNGKFKHVQVNRSK